MKEAVALLQNASAVAFVLLGAVTAASWLRRRDRSTGFLALAIVLLSGEVLVGRLAALFQVNLALVGQLSVIAFLGSGYALLRYRGSLIPLPRRWHAAAIASMVAASGFLIVAEAAGAGRGMLTAGAVALVLVWSAAVGEPIVRFWLVARDQPAVQAWRLRSLSLGFGGLVVVLLFAISAQALANDPLVQLGIGLLVLAIVPFLYVSFSPPAWLRREWRAAEEEGLRKFMEELLLSEDRDALAVRALDWATRLVGGASAVAFDSSGSWTASSGFDARQIEQLKAQLPHLVEGAGRITLDGSAGTVLSLPIAGLSGGGTLVALAGPYTPGFGPDEIRRVQQFMSAFVTALDRRHLIEQLKETNVRLVEANRHKSVFLANMSHELRTPLNAIIGFSELMTDAREDQFDAATRKRFLAQIHSSGKHLLGLINDILDLSKVEAGQMELRLQSVHVAEVADQVARTVEPLVAQKEIRLVVDVAPAGSVVADAGKLKQMLLNLVSNAIKFTPEGGTVTIAGRRRADAVEISVADTGIGIADSDQKQIFQEFHQIDQGAGRMHEGTGLGLALTRRFAMLHGGDVQVQSRVSKGSVFTISLPIRPEPVSTAPVVPVVQGTVSNGHGTGAVVLVVEDDPGAAELLTRHLGIAGYRTHVARTGTEALAMAKELKPAAITLDIILPELDGWEVLSRLKSEPATEAIPIVVVSVVDNPELGIALGALDYMVKPVDARELVARLNRLDFNRTVGHDHVRVLVVDDEPANREWLTAALEPAGFTVVPASGGREAIDTAVKDKPDLVLLDLMMPEVSGFDVVEALRKDEATRQTPIMIVTSATLSEADRRQLHGRVADIMSRGSVSAGELAGVLKRVLAGSHSGTA